MGLFDFFRSKTVQPPKPATFTRQEPDLDDSLLIKDLLLTAKDKREDSWYQAFYLHVQTAGFIVGEPQVSVGPDGFSYFVLNIPGENDHAIPVSIQNIKADLLEKGLGVVINPAGNAADWVFSYGDIVNLCLRNEFISENDDANVNQIEMSKPVTVKKGEQLLFAQPSAAYFPLQARKALKIFLQQCGIKEPKLLLLSRKSGGEMIQELAFNVHPEDFPSKEAIGHRMQQIGWFLPKHYLLVTFSKNDDMRKQFANL